MTTETRRLRAPAKVNLGLRLVGVRPDGYHLLESIFAPIGVWDDVELELVDGPQGVDFSLDFDFDPDSAAAGRDPDASSSDEVRSMAPALRDVGDGADNLVVRAAMAFAKATGFDRRVRVGLTKRIPAGAGLGGGSSDAAAVLRGLVSLAEVILPGEALHDLALGLGADVPFFLDPKPAFVAGIGDQIERLDAFPSLDLVVMNPGMSLSTPEVYRATDALQGALTDARAGSTMRAISRLRGETGDFAHALGDLLINDLEPAAKRLCPPVARLLAELREVGAIGVSMSGSGATVFGVFASGESANTAAAALRRSRADECWIKVTQIITSD